MYNSLTTQSVNYFMYLLNVGSISSGIPLGSSTVDQVDKGLEVKGWLPRCCVEVVRDTVIGQGEEAGDGKPLQERTSETVRKRL